MPYNSISTNDIKLEGTAALEQHSFFSVLVIFICFYLLIKFQIAFDPPAESNGPASNSECAATIIIVTSMAYVIVIETSLACLLFCCDFPPTSNMHSTFMLPLPSTLTRNPIAYVLTGLTTSRSNSCHVASLLGD